jgi:hypothetical protein
MKSVTKLQLLLLLLVNLVTFNACSNTNVENKNANTKNNRALTTEISPVSGLKVATKVQTELDNAKKIGNALFVVVTEKGTVGTDKALTIAKKAKVIYKNAVVVQLNRDDVSNAKLINEWRLTGAPLPLILVISSKGTPTGGYLLDQATAEKVAGLVPSPKMENVNEAIASGKPAFIVFSKKSMIDKTHVLKICKDAVTKLNNNAVIVEVDMDDSKEANFLTQLRIDKLSKSSITLVVNKQGQLAGAGTTEPNAAKLAAAATAVVSSGCGSSCGPAGCGK